MRLINKILEEEINKFSPISLSEMDEVKLMNRCDTKFLINKRQLIKLIPSLNKHYKVLEINDSKLMSYASLYFDTSNLKFYNDHHNGKNNRIKVRMRKYIESDICFLEIKQKNAKGETKKSRILIDDFEHDLSDTSNDFILDKTKQNFKLSPSLTNNFNRFTMVNVASQERVTVDLNINFSKGNQFKAYDDLVVIELKQEQLDRISPIYQALKEIQVSPYSFSKYCIGMVCTNPDLKYNKFKQKLIKINKVSA